MAKSNENEDPRSQLRGLKFINPGPAQEFNPEQSLRQERKLKRMIQQNTKKQNNKKTMYDDCGHLVVDGRDLCDCLNESCPGCFYPCEKCRSRKCGKDCRSLRKWYYESVEVEEGQLRSFPFFNQDHMTEKDVKS